MPGQVAPGVGPGLGQPLLLNILGIGRRGRRRRRHPLLFTARQAADENLLLPQHLLLPVQSCSASLRLAPLRHGLLQLPEGLVACRICLWVAIIQLVLGDGLRLDLALLQLTDQLLVALNLSLLPLNLTLLQRRLLLAPQLCAMCHLLLPARSPPSCIFAVPGGVGRPVGHELFIGLPHGFPALPGALQSQQASVPALRVLGPDKLQDRPGLPIAVAALRSGADVVAITARLARCRPWSRL
mmetsp:Transcript_29654/g.95787  ORF Transcript_29654/g.95787 Transcript_29654/m.95787 type:complete len:241 (+) Transcript_29654:2095-2817(+)|eukprot:scaffold14602_cov118-Isochrysis_galbana.AAC.9